MSVFRDPPQQPALPKAPPPVDRFDRIWIGGVLLALVCAVFAVGVGFGAIGAALLSSLALGITASHTRGFAKWRRRRATKRALEWVDRVDAAAEPARVRVEAVDAGTLVIPQSEATDEVMSADGASASRDSRG